MVIENVLKKRNFGFGALALMTALSLGACADAGESDSIEDVEASAQADAEAQTGAPEELAAVATAAAGSKVNQPGTVATLGDSWMSNTLFTGNAITGALGRAGHRYRNYAVQGVMLLKDNLFGRSVRNQAVRALRDLPNLKTVIITGGGNDIIENAALQSACGRTPIGPACETKLKEIEAAMIQLWNDFGDGGVQDVVYVAYAQAAGSAPNAASASRDRLREDCAELTEKGGIRCHFIATDDIVPSKAQLILDGIHPTQASNNQIARKIFNELAATDSYR